ncbi:hypothetical protein [Paraburkholderia humisilvae]|uniref:Uncharacterized protein n=1 Tax=Paraburkholderia humisilvae TaxID=627669 RepID=A0A6J5DM43_9BURK|nr:hypothetical protein [Paraburkholderia humisilvae]CAB3754547.1 hypothetical protein LMG29542_02380 [Paraburkholderia humisilvae]
MQKAMYVTDDRDLPDGEQRSLVIFPGGNGDWYVQVAPKHGRAIEGVRISTSGGAQMHCPGLGPAIAQAYRAMLAAQNGEKRAAQRSLDELESEVRAWRSKFPKLEFDGLFRIVEIE